MNLWAGPAAIAASYYLLALFAAFRRSFAKVPTPRFFPAVSILKPVHGRDPQFYEAIRSHATQHYPEFEILFGATDAADPAIKDIERLATEYPACQIRLIVTRPQTANGKVGLLSKLAREARHQILLVNDSDIVVGPDYLRHAVAPLEDLRIGVATCLYRAKSYSWPGRWEAIGIATEFVPSVLVARTIGIAQFALGSTMAMRASELRQIGGFDALGEYLADDYQLGRRISGLGYRVALANTVVETNLSAETWSDAWRHQLRWARTIRVSRAAGYYGYVVTQASFWAVVAALMGSWKIALAAVAIRVLAGVVVASRVLHDGVTSRYFFLIPFRDLWGFAVWTAGLLGSTVEWRGEKLRLDRDGRIIGAR